MCYRAAQHNRAARLAKRFRTCKDGLPIAVQSVGSWRAETTILRVAYELESLSTVRDFHTIT